MLIKAICAKHVDLGKTISNLGFYLTSYCQRSIKESNKGHDLEHNRMDENNKCDQP